MRKKSYGSVTVYESNAQAVQEMLSSYAKQLSRRNEVLAVWLVGSYHRKDFTPFSDADVVIVVRSSQTRFIDRSFEYAPEVASILVDLFVYTTEEIEEMRRSSHRFWEEIEQNHTVLFERESGNGILHS